MPLLRRMQTLLRVKHKKMVEFEKFENEMYNNEKEEFLSDKCGCCMSYLDENKECENVFCESKIPSEYR